MALPFASVPRIFRVDDVLCAEDLEAWARLSEDVYSWFAVEHKDNGAHFLSNSPVAAALIEAGASSGAQWVVRAQEGFRIFRTAHAFAQHYFDFTLPAEIGPGWQGVCSARYNGAASDAELPVVEKLDATHGRVYLGLYSSGLTQVLVVINGELS